MSLSFFFLNRFVNFVIICPNFDGGFCCGVLDEGLHIGQLGDVEECLEGREDIELSGPLTMTGSPAGCIPSGYGTSQRYFDGFSLTSVEIFDFTESFSFRPVNRLSARIDQAEFRVTVLVQRMAAIPFRTYGICSISDDSWIGIKLPPPVPVNVKRNVTIWTVFLPRTDDGASGDYLRCLVFHFDTI